MITSWTQLIPSLAELLTLSFILQWVLPSGTPRNTRLGVALRFLGVTILKNLLTALWWRYYLNELLSPAVLGWEGLLLLYAELAEDLLCIGVALWSANRPPRLLATCGQAAVTYVVYQFALNFANAFFTSTELGVMTARLQYNTLVALALCFVFWGLARLLKLKQHYQKHPKGTYILFLALLGLQFIAVPLPYFFTLYSYELYLYSLSLLLLYLPALIFLALLFVVLFLVAIRNADRKRQLRETSARIDDMNAILDDTKKSVHDFHKHIRHLQSLVAVHTADGTTAELQSQVDAYCAELLSHSEQDEMLLHLGDPTFRALLYGRRTQAKDAGIEFIVDASPVLPHFPVKNYQLVEIFENLLDNAFDGASELSGKRWIRVVLTCDTVGDTCEHTLCIQNPYEQLDLEQILSGQSHTTKGGEHQGIGLDKVSQLVQSTGGTLSVNHADRLFSVKVSYKEAL